MMQPMCLVVLGVASAHVAASFPLADTYFVLVPFLGYFRWPVGVPLLAIAATIALLLASSWRSLAGGSLLAIALTRAAPWPRYYRRPVVEGDYWADGGGRGGPIRATPNMLLDGEGTLLLSQALAPAHQGGWVLPVDDDPFYTFFGLGYVNFGGSFNFGLIAPPAIYELQQRLLANHTRLLPRLAAHWGIAPSSIDVGRSGRLRSHDNVVGPSLQMMLGNVFWGVAVNPHNDIVYSPSKRFCWSLL